MDSLGRRAEEDVVDVRASDRAAPPSCEDDELVAAHPQNRHVRETIRDQLQILRDLDEVQFIDDEGTYRRTA